MKTFSARNFAAAALVAAAALSAPAVSQASTQITENPSKTYTITTTDWALALEIPGGSKGDGAPLSQWGQNGGANQKWRLQALGPGCICVDHNYWIVNVNSGKCLTAPGGSITAGTKLVQWVCGRAGQRWSFFGDYDGDSTVEIVNGSGGLPTGYGFSYFPAIEVPGGSLNWGTQLELGDGGDTFRLTATN